MPATYWTFKRLGVIEKLKASHFPEKYSVQFYSSSGKGSAPFYFYRNDPHESSMTWQVLRSEFDQMLLENAQEKGAEVQRGVSVHEVLFDGERAVGVRAKLADGRIVELSAKVIVDSTGQSALISRRLKINRTEPQLKKASIFTHFEGGIRDRGIDEGATLILHTESKDSWFWSIPLPYDRVSVGVVGDLGYLLQDRRRSDGTLSHQAIFDEELAKCPALQPRLANAKQLFPVKVTKDFSYRANRIAGDGWVLVGDAFGFLGSRLLLWVISRPQVRRDGKRIPSMRRWKRKIFQQISWEVSVLNLWREWKPSVNWFTPSTQKISVLPDS